MNFASWVILAIVLVLIGLAISATFFAKKKGGCCDTGDATMKCPAEGCSACSCTSCHASDMQARIRELPTK